MVFWILDCISRPRRAEMHGARKPRIFAIAGDRSLFCTSLVLSLVNLFVVVVLILQRMTSILPGTLPQLGPDRHQGQVNWAISFLCCSLFSLVSRSIHAMRVSGGGLELRVDVTSELARDSGREATSCRVPHLGGGGGLWWWRWRYATAAKVV